MLIPEPPNPTLPGPPLKPPESNPVSWHIIIWILFTLAINSMASAPNLGEICHLPGKYRLYLSSSPIISSADAFCMLSRLVFISWYLKVSPQKASRLVLLGEMEIKNRQEFFEMQEVSENRWGHLWPRWFFFVVGTLPAAIKMASFSGNPWTNTWGMMSLSSFVVTEVMSLVSRNGGGYTEEELSLLDSVTHSKPKIPSQRRVQGGAVDDEETELPLEATQNHGTKMYIICEFWTRLLLSSAAILAHAVLIFWAIDNIWMQYYKSTQYDFDEVHKWSNYVVVGLQVLCGLALLIWAIIRRYIKKVRDHVFSKSVSFWNVFFALTGPSMVSGLIPAKKMF